MNFNKKLIKGGVCLTFCSLVIAAGGCRTETSQILKEGPPQIYYNYTELQNEDFNLLYEMNIRLDLFVEEEIIEWFISPEIFRYIGTFNWNGYRWTYYSERVLPGGGLNIPGRWSDTYFVRDGEGNICLASSDLGWGTYVPTPWGQGRVYDSGCASGTLDVYVTW